MISSLKIVHWNANGITKRINELGAFIFSNKPDIILLNETHLKSNLSLKIPNYITYRNDLPQIRGSPAHGGTAILVHRKIVHQQIDTNTKLQSTSILIKISNKTTLISSVYKPPSSPLLTSDLDLLINSADNFIIAGDLNSKHPLWNSRKTNAAGSILYSHLLQNDYAIFAPDTPTHFPSSNKCRPDVLDIALIRTQFLVHVTTLNELSSDHNPILLELTDSPITTSSPPPNLQINWDKFYHTLNAEKPNTALLTNSKQNIDISIQALTNSIQSALDNCSYTRDRGSRRLVIPAEIQQEINEKTRIRREWQLNRDPQIKRSLNSKIKTIRLMLQTHRKDEWDKYIASMNQNENSIYKLNRSLLKKKPAVHPILGPNGLSYSAKEKSEIIADSLERQFSTFKGPDLPEVKESIAALRGSVLTGPNIFTTPGSIQKLISKLAKNKAPGRDQITNTALKFLPKNKLLDLTKIINGCFNLCYFPSVWKLSSIISIPKPGKNHQLPESYRPIALLSSLSKVYERLILQSLQKSLAGKIRDEQFAFRQNHSTVLQLTKLMDQISENLNQNIQTAAIFLDVEKAFDSVWHDGLLHKMMSTNIPLQLIKITESFLSERTFSVKIENQNSSIRKANAGVPQGSCLSPTLFNIYTNDLPTLPKSRVSLFADDTMFYCSNHNARFASFQLQKQINLASDWFKKWRLHINESKTSAILFGRTGTAKIKNININNVQIPWSRSVKYLGVTIDRNFSFSTHTSNIIKKATQIRGLLYPILNKKSPIPTRTKLNLFQMYIIPILTYAGEAWAPFVSSSTWKKIEAVQTTGIRIILGQPTFVRNSVLLHTVGFIPIQKTIKKNASATFHRIANSWYNHIRTIGRCSPSLYTVTEQTYTTKTAIIMVNTYHYWEGNTRP